MYKYFIFIMIIGFTVKTCPLWAQLNPDMLTFYDDLEGNSVNDIVSDDQGNIWIASMGGLMKFDGYDLVRFHPDLNDSTTMGELLTYVLHKDENGNLWIGAQEGIYFYNSQSKTFKRYIFDHLVNYPDFALAGAATIVQGNDKRIYVGISSTMGIDGSNSLIYYDATADTFKSYEHQYADSLHGTFEALRHINGTIYLRDFNGIFTLDTTHQLKRMFWDEQQITNYGYPIAWVCDPNGIIWFASHLSKLVAYNPQSESVQSWSMLELFNEPVTNNWRLDMAVGPEGQIWIGTDLGLVSFDPLKNSFQTFHSGDDYPLRKERYMGLYFDQFGNLWAGTDSEELVKYSNRAILDAHRYDSQNPQSITFGWVGKIIENTLDGTIWLQSYPDGNGGINCFDPASKELDPLPTTTLGPNIQHFGLLGEIYPGTALASLDFEGHVLFDFADRTLRDTLLPQIPDSTMTITIYKDSREILWYATLNGLYADVPGKEKYNYYDLTAFPLTNSATNEISMVYESPFHGLWILTSEGLFSFDYNSGIITRHAWDPDQGDVLPSQDINSFYEEPNGIAWIGTWQGGLCRYDVEKGKIKTYTVSDGLASMSIQGILGDERNNTLWLSTFSGISRFNYEEEEFNNFSISDGIQGMLYSDFSYLKSSGNLFLFGGNNGVTFFNPNEINKNSFVPIVYITDFKVADQSVTFVHNEKKQGNTTSRLFLPYEQNNVAFEYTAIQYDNPSKNQFSYRLENYDDNWRHVRNLRSAIYYNLPPGSYTFRVKAANSNGVWNDVGASVSFTVQPPWWLTWWAYALYGLIFILLIIAFDRIQRKRLAEKARQHAKEKELEAAKEIEKAYHKLKTTQTQLLHAEKMASLGELTAGIAHEIQNPLNFVNNFSDVSVDMIDEMNEEIDEGNTDEVINIAVDLKQNLEKIHHHGERASRIVKGMLEHSRTGNNEKVPTDINMLADEYLRLAYHGLRAKDNTFNAEYKTELDSQLPKIKVVPQDIGRVLLNIINNAFYATSERAKMENGDFKPLVTIKTAQEKQRVIISITDNGKGIPDAIREKIFHPFFTTKSTGEGTGLGLSLSYDIITKGHGGSLDVHSQPGSGTEMVIQLNK